MHSDFRWINRKFPLFFAVRLRLYILSSPYPSFSGYTFCGVIHDVWERAMSRTRCWDLGRKARLTADNSIGYIIRLYKYRDRSELGAATDAVNIPCVQWYNVIGAFHGTERERERERERGRWEKEEDREGEFGSSFRKLTLALHNNKRRLSPLRDSKLFVADLIDPPVPSPLIVRFYRSPRTLWLIVVEECVCLFACKRFCEFWISAKEKSNFMYK